MLQTMYKILQKTDCKSNSFSDLVVVEQEEKSQTLQTKTIERTTLSIKKKRGQLNAAGLKSWDVNISFNLGKLQSSKLSSSAKEKDLEVNVDDLAGLCK